MSARPLRSRDLLRRAERLAGLGAPAGRPRTVDLRGAVSSAYYAVFHELTTRSAQMVVDGHVGGPPSEKALRVSRWFSHADMKSLAQSLLGGRGPQPLRDLFVTVSPELRRVCESFITLQELRHLADYEHSYDVDRRSTTAVVQDCDDTLSRLSVLRSGSDPSYLLFLRLAAGSVRIAKER